MNQKQLNLLNNLKKMRNIEKIFKDLIEVNRVLEELEFDIETLEGTEEENIETLVTLANTATSKLHSVSSEITQLDYVEDDAEYNKEMIEKEESQLANLPY